MRTLRVHGPMGGGELQRTLGMSQAAFSRAAAACGAALVTQGRARATRYGAVREIAGVARPLPVYELDAYGRAFRLSGLIPVWPDA